MPASMEFETAVADSGGFLRVSNGPRGVTLQTPGAFMTRLSDQEAYLVAYALLTACGRLPKTLKAPDAFDPSRKG